MRDGRFVAEHRGGLLAKEKHYQLMQWACDCAEHVLPLVGKNIDPRLISALEIAHLWKLGKASVGEARKASVEAIAVARESSDKTMIAVARAVGHAVATAHMGDHSLGSAWYGLKALQSSGESVENERKWQNSKLPPEIEQLVLSARKERKM
jgi:hypothetical protein